MKITNVQAICLRYDYKDPIADGCTPCLKRTAVLVRVDTDTELYGIGESATFGCSTTAMKAVVEDQLAPLLIGEDPTNIEKLYQKMLWNSWSAGRRGILLGGISGIDIALWDLLGKAAGMPLYRLLGANSDRVAGYASAGFYAEGKTMDDLKREMEGYLDQGFTTFKMKIGRSRDVLCSPLRYMNKGDYTVSMEQDLERIRRVREAIGPENRLMVDMNCTWDVHTVLSHRKFLEENHIFWIEEPVRSDQVGAYAELTRKLKGVLVAGIESEQGLSRYRELLEAKALDVVQANIGWTGGITEGRRIAALSQAYGKLFSPHTFFSAVMAAANVHFAASLSNVPFVEWELNPNPLRTELLKQGIETNERCEFILPDRPGLGIEIDWERAEQWME